jgi:hypothetical protein
VSAGPGEFFHAAHRVFLSAQSNEQHYSIAGLVARFEIAGRASDERLTRAFGHLQLPVQQHVDLTICAWDSVGTGTKMVPPPWTESDYGSRGEIRLYNNERFRTAFDQGTSALSMIDHERGLALFWTRDAQELPSYESGAPFRTILNWWAERNDLVLVHCGAIGTERGAAILAGPGGSGKSTTALLCAQAGWNYLADDYCLLQVAEPSRVFSLYNSAKLGHDQLSQFKTLAGKSAAMDGDKHLFFLNDIWQKRLTRSLPSRLLLLPRVSGDRDTLIEPASAGEALRAVAPSTIFQLSGAGQTSFQRLSSFVERIPVRHLNLGRDFEKIPERISACLSEM